MRFVLDTLVALMIVGLAVGAFMHFKSSRGTEQRVQRTRMELRRFDTQLSLKAQLGQVEVSTANYPMTIDPAWFADNLPSNPLLHRGHPLVEIATEQQQDLQHPVERTVSDRDRNLAQFWYNPYRGILRARVPDAGTDAKTLSLYNRVNDCRLPNLFATGNDG